MTNKKNYNGWLSVLSERPRAELAQLPTPIHPLKNFGAQLDGPELWIKRDDLTGLAGGGNKTRKLEFIVGDAVKIGADMLITVGAIQSNHTRQTAAAAAKVSLKCALLHNGWTKDSGPLYRQVGNIFYSSLMGADLYEDNEERPIEDEGPLEELADYLRKRGHKSYVIPGGASDHRLGSFGYMVCAAEIVEQAERLGFQFDYVVHCTGSSSTQSGLIAGFAALGVKTRVIGISDDDETVIKRERVLRLSNAALEELGQEVRVTGSDVEITVGDAGHYGVSDSKTLDIIKLLAHTEGLIADPVYEGKAIRGLLDLAENGRLEDGSKVLLMHLGGTPATHAYANQFGDITLKPIPSL
jgi:1-aminocyclopropane-1-carboxylate deaminase